MRALLSLRTRLPGAPSRFGAWRRRGVGGLVLLAGWMGTSLAAAQVVLPPDPLLLGGGLIVSTPANVTFSALDLQSANPTLTTTHTVEINTTNSNQTLTVEMTGAAVNWNDFEVHVVVTDLLEVTSLGVGSGTPTRAGTQIFAGNEGPKVLMGGIRVVRIRANVRVTIRLKNRVALSSLRDFLFVYSLF